MLAGESRLADVRTIIIKLEGDTAGTLIANGFQLYAFQAMDTNIAGWPTIWFATGTLAQTLTLQIDSAAQAYTTLPPDMRPPAVVTPGALYPIAAGQTLRVTSTAGTGSVVDGGLPGALSILDTTTTQFTCGATAGLAGAAAAPACAVQLFGGNQVLLRPRPAYFVAFESSVRSVGQAVRALSAPGLLVSLEDASSRTVSYALNTNWSANTDAWATQYPAGTDLTTVLIDPVLGIAASRRAKAKPADG